MQREFFYKNKRRGVYEGRFHDLHPIPGKFKIRVLASISDLDHYPAKRRQTILRNLWLSKYEAIQNEPSTKTDEPSAPSFMEVGQAWLDAIATIRSKRTILEYSRSLSLYVEACGNHPLTSVPPLHETKLNRILEDRKMTSTTRKKHLVHLNIFWKWANRKRFLTELVRYDLPRVTVRNPRPYTARELQKLEIEIRRRGHKNLLRAFVLLTETGMREGEIWAMRLDWVEEGRWIRVQDVPGLQTSYGDDWQPKGRHEGRVPISPTLKQFIAEDPRGSQEQWWLDDGRGNQNWTRTDTLYRAMKRVCVSVGITDTKPLHAIRSYVITELLAQGVPLSTVRDIARHSDIKTTLGYANLKTLEKNTAEAIKKLPRISSVPYASP